MHSHRLLFVPSFRDGPLRGQSLTQLSRCDVLGSTFAASTSFGWTCGQWLHPIQACLGALSCAPGSSSFRNHRIAHICVRQSKTQVHCRQTTPRWIQWRPRGLHDCPHSSEEIPKAAPRRPEANLGSKTASKRIRNWTTEVYWVVIRATRQGVNRLELIISLV